MATSVAGISFELSFDGSKMMQSINASCQRVKDRFEQSFSQAAKKSAKSIETGNKEIDKILSDTERSAKSKAAAIASIYKKQGKTQSNAFKEAWRHIERESEDGARKVKKSIQSIGDQSQKSSKEVENNFSGTFSSIAKKAGAALAAAFAVKKIVDFGKKCVELGSDLAEVQNVVDVTFPRMTAQIDKFAKSAATSFGLSETMAKKYTGTFGAMAKAFGFSEQATYDMSTALTGLTGDVASFYNLSQDEAYTKLKSVFTGETESLKDLGVVMTQTALDSYALAHGFGKTTSAMTEAEKVSLRYAFVQDQLSAAQGDFSRTSDSWANQVRILQLQMESFMATIGQGLINLFTPIIKVINIVIGKLITLANAFKAFTELITGKNGSSNVASPVTDLSGAADSAADGLENASGAADGLGDSTKKAGKAAQKAAQQMRALMGFDKINRLDQQTSTNSDTGSTPGSGSTNPGTGSAVDFGSLANGETIIDKTDSKFSKLFQDIVKLSQPALNALKKLWDEGLARLGQFAWNSLKDFFNGFLIPVGKWVLGKGIPDFVNALNDGLMKVNYESLEGSLKKLWDALAPFAINVGEGLLWCWQNVLVPLGTWTANEVAPRFIDSIRIAIEAFNAILTALQPLFQWFWDSVLQPLANWAADAFLSAWDGINNLLQKFSEWCSTNPEIVQTMTVIVASFFAAWKIMDLVSGFTKMIEKIGGVAGIIKKLGALTGSTLNPWVLAIGAVIAAGVLLYKNWDKIKEVAGKVGKFITETFSRAADNIKRNFEDLIGKTTKVWGKIQTLFSNFGNWLDSIFSTDWTKTFGAFGEVLNAFSKTASDVISGIEGIFNGLITMITGVFTGNWKQAWEGIKQIFAGVFSGLAGLAKAPLNTLIGAFNGIISIINSLINKINGIRFRITIPDWVPGIGGRGFGFDGFHLPNIGTIPALASGGFVEKNTPQLAMIGDNRHQGEVVAPENKLQEMVDEAVSRAGAGGVTKAELESIMNRAVLRLIAALASVGFNLDGEKLATLQRMTQTSIDRRYNTVTVS